MKTAAIEVRGARRVYGFGPSAMVALDDVDLSVQPGRFVSVIGPSGCGKSTLLRLVAGLEPADRGEVGIHGVSPEEACAAKMVGLVPQTPALLPWLSVLKNVTLPQKVNRGAARRRAAIGEAADRVAPPEPPDMAELLRKAGLAEAAHKLPGELSGGMQQRTAIVRAFGLQPEVLLMDEPFSALDEFTRESLQEQLLDLWDELKTTVLFVTHSVSEAVRLSDAIVIMAAKPGRIIDVVNVDLPRPRGRDLLKTPEFHHLEDLIRDKLRGAWHTQVA
ncbi:sulfonate ABC transporter ATP-binding protein [Saccharothrix sp. ALI-22-I]|uniref:ABC transporter ATP-binding protein n=1 Tax=Saccharothrix sp. ALI-22-I TaxID=1933778 RepID=UPI00097C8D6C|nr:ABC transporter ATP-binding protein [Saccharothrix sp. ALI-22-I]ONI88890.1 sulfonate ABC transporter ATP-binding protein [Saccharothrix sp. ALI-22-I]